MGYLAANRFFKSTVEPIVKMYLNQSNRFIMSRHFNRSRQTTVGTRRQSSESGNPRSPNGENKWDVPGFGKMKVSDVLTLAGFAVSLIGVGMNTGMNTWMILRQLASEDKKSEEEKEERRVTNTRLLSMDWREIANSRKAVLHRHDGVLNAVFPFLYAWNDTNDQSRHEGATTTNKSTVVNTKPAPESFREVIQFFLQWEHFHKRNTIDSADLKQQLCSDFDTFHKHLTEVRDKEAKSWHKTDKERLRDVVDFLDKISKREKEG